ncbi:GNAT family N-acetyltransferase [Clostridium folliculivorans]|uniref:N-acetyltransferase n=1 Tax=Clostridium folliculivorans TaxID=2886038 RepID=A0A9W6D9R7_9CLOT|nr:GNAT family N-acetyltransferase [Clostridium folliculivorans]GKU24419.1 N-acetyltransferase [Clostridium folliculivorans]GKU30515.1 N-acetyltransferase [Clostridium folliculivorans]
MSRSIRYASLKDSDVLGKVHSESSHAAFKSIIPEDVLNEVFSIERRTKRFVSELTEGSPRTAIVFEDNEPAGLLSFGKCRYGNNDNSWVEIWRVYLTPTYWGSGAAKELIEWGIDEIQKDNFMNIELWVLKENIRARNFYEKMGFKHDNTIQITNVGKELSELRYIKV